MNIPTKEECLELLKENKVHKSIQEHSKFVAKIAVFLAKKLKEKGIEINIDLIESAGLLHDISKAVDFTYFKGLDEEELKKAKELRQKYEHIDHAEAAYLELKNKYPEVAEIIRVHNPRHIFDAKTWEQKILNYADKRAQEYNLVSLQKRISDLEKKYKFTMSEEMKNTYFQLEKQIFDIIKIEPNKLGEYIE